MAARPNRIKHRKSPYKFIVSACLAGIDCTYNRKNKTDKCVKALVDKGAALPLCAEVLGGLSVPRENSEIAGGAGSDVWNNMARVVTVSGRDISKNFKRGACKVLRLAKRYNIRKAILKSKSPSCGIGDIYDGTFTGTLKKGDGVLVSLLLRNKIDVCSEKLAKVR